MKLFDKILGTNKGGEVADLTTITRTEALEGFSIPGIIRNSNYYYAPLQVYSDGLIDCWEMVDLPMFKDKLYANWVVTSVPDGQVISFFSLGNWVIDKGKWIYTKDSFYSYVRSLVKRLNPGLENLHNYKGSNSRLVNKNFSVAKHFSPRPKPYYHEDIDSYDPKKISGEKFNIFFRNDDDKTYLAELSVYKNGLIIITNIPQKKTFRIEGLKELIDKEQITTNLKTGESVTITGLGSFVIQSGSGVEMNFKHQEFVDQYNELNGAENSIAKCKRIFEAYKQNPSIKLKEELRQAYEAVPAHQRIFVGTMDTKDFEVRQVIYGDIVKKEFEDHYGFEYPYDDMPKPVDE